MSIYVIAIPHCKRPFIISYPFETAVKLEYAIEVLYDRDITVLSGIDINDAYNELYADYHSFKVIRNPDDLAKAYKDVGDHKKADVIKLLDYIMAAMTDMS